MTFKRKTPKAEHEAQPVQDKWANWKYEDGCPPDAPQEIVARWRARYEEGKKAYFEQQRLKNQPDNK